MTRPTNAEFQAAAREVYEYAFSAGEAWAKEEPRMSSTRFWDEVMGDIQLDAYFEARNSRLLDMVIEAFEEGYKKRGGSVPLEERIT